MGRVCAKSATALSETRAQRNDEDNQAESSPSAGADLRLYFRGVSAGGIAGALADGTAPAGSYGPVLAVGLGAPAGGGLVAGFAAALAGTPPGARNGTELP